MSDLVLEGTVRERVVKAGELSHPHAFVFPIQAEVQLDGWERRSRDGNVGSCHPYVKRCHKLIQSESGSEPKSEPIVSGREVEIWDYMRFESERVDIYQCYRYCPEYCIDYQFQNLWKS